MSRRRAAAGRALRAALVFAPPVVFILVPLATFLAQSFFWVEDGALIHRVTLRNYQRFLGDPALRSTFLSSGALCLGAALATVALGYPAALLLASLRGRLRSVLSVLFVVPLLMSYIVKIYALRALLGSNGFLNRSLLWLGLISEPWTFLLFNRSAIVLTLSLLLVPFAILPIFLALERIPRSLLEASADLGASAWQTFARVVLPLSLPGVWVGGASAFALALGDFLTPQMVGGPSGFTFGRAIYSQFGLAFNWPFGSALSAILLAVVLAVAAAAARAARSRYAA